MGLTDAPDERLMSLAAAGNRLALDTLMQRWHRPLHAFISHSGGAEPEDLCQETWMRVARSSGSFDPAQSFKAWIFSIAANVCRDAFRAAEARPGTVGLDAAASIPAPQREEDERASLMRECFASLPPRDRQVLSLRFYQGLKESEVAEVLGIPVGTVKSRAHVAAARLHTLMLEGNVDDETENAV